MTLTLTNTGSRDLHIEYGPAMYQDMFVFGEDGVEVWSKLGGTGVIPDIGASTDLKSGESVNFDTEWPTVNNDREIVAPGEYHVQATFSFWESGSSYTTGADLVTQPQAITVVPASS